MARTRCRTRCSRTGLVAKRRSFVTGWLLSYDRSGVLHGHIAWHEALSALERGDPGRALAIYEQHVQPPVSLGTPINIMTDTVSLLWRLNAYGREVPAALWDHAKAYAESKFPSPGFAFADAHIGLLAAATGDKRAATERIDALTRLVEDGALAAGPVVPAICRAALAFADGDHAACVRILEPMAGEVARIGGSGAQREVVERFGASKIVAVGLLLTGAASAVGLLGIEAAHFWATLILLGMGWNFGFVGASAMVLECHRPEEKARVQPFNDFVVFGTMAVGSFLSGGLLSAFGWDMVLWLSFAPVLVASFAPAAGRSTSVSKV